MAELGKTEKVSMRPNMSQPFALWDYHHHQCGTCRGASVANKAIYGESTCWCDGAHSTDGSKKTEPYIWATDHVSAEIKLEFRPGGVEIRANVSSQQEVEVKKHCAAAWQWNLGWGKLYPSLINNWPSLRWSGPPAPRLWQKPLNIHMFQAPPDWCHSVQPVFLL